MPDESKYLIFDDFSGGMNTQPARQGLNEKFGSWIENLQVLGPNFLLGVQGPAAALAMLTGETVVKIYPGLIGAQDYLIAFCASGAAYTTTVAGAVGKLATGGTVVNFAPAGTFSATGGDLVSYNAARFLIADAQAGYCTYDGTVFASQGGVSPNFQITAGGSGYANGATGAVTGGSGAGAAISVQTTAGVVTGVTLVNPGTGFLAGDSLTVTITAVSGGSGATANAHVWPFLLPQPSTLAIGFGRVWLANGRTLILSGTGSATFGAGYDDFATGDASVTTTISDIDLVHSITALRFLENYLYIIGDNSVKSIGGISVSGGTTNFTITTLSSDQGTLYQNTVLSYNRLIVFTNTVGVFAVFGASVEKISDQMDGIFRLANFTQPPSAAVNEVNQIHTLLVLIKYIDPVIGARSLLMAYSGKRWYVINQGTGVLFIATSILGGHADTFGTSGADITQLLQDTIKPLAYKLQTSMTPHGDPIHDKRVIRAGIAQQVSGVSDLTMVIDTENGSAVVPLQQEFVVFNFVNNSGQALMFTNNAGQTLSFAGSGFLLSHSGTFSVTGRYVGSTIAGTLNGIAVQGAFIEYQDAAAWGKG